ncbi:uncharacterized protein F5891DRAFT_1210139 [Suillus fuscotomentosus]|uniref:Uncharacterized protein n=1 Tax=Suillus fuscotomentosus TaxID=1912939 RepID=A0AAD4HP31_9AGAM|nr:uncharacterized protein F5891DRAFT_1210139 [Suillus fuscotomentosus]KAG1903597.1 hypothetical protein F5891DRAFT_1210139 [Suillus fuscotomentosus]
MFNPEEQQLHQAALSSSEKASSTLPITHNFKYPMLKVLSNAAGVISFRAVMKNEIKVKKDMSGEEAMVLSHIHASANEDIWTKYLKAKTELHQTSIDRYSKLLVQKQLVKAVRVLPFKVLGAFPHMLALCYASTKIARSTSSRTQGYNLQSSLRMDHGTLTTNMTRNYQAPLNCILTVFFSGSPSQNKTPPKTNANSTSLAMRPPIHLPSTFSVFLTKRKITETRLGIERIEML